MLLNKKRLPIFLLAGLGVFLICIVLLASYFRLSNADQDKRIGVSFSQKQAESYKLDWQKAYIATVSELGITDVRIMSYWDRHEKSKDNYDFTELDFMIEQAELYNIDVSLVLGNRQPRWPECHTPAWVSNNLFENELLEYIEIVANRYKQNPAIRQFQLENEAANNHFGKCPPYSSTFFTKEYELIKSITDKPIAINTSNQSGIPVVGPTGDRTGFSVYRHSHFPLLGKSQHWSFWYVPSAWHAARAGLVQLLHGGAHFVHELQAEPWATGPTESSTSAEQYSLFPPSQIETNLNFVKSAGFNEAYLWGAEYWYWRKTTHQDPNYWLAAQTAIKEF